MNDQAAIASASDFLQLRQKLAQAEDVIDAIRRGAVDGFLADDGQVYTLQSADHIYRVLFDTMNEGAVTLALDGCILYANRRFSEMVRLPVDALIGRSFAVLLRDDDQTAFARLIHRGLEIPSRADFLLQPVEGGELSVLLSVSTLVPHGISAVCVLVTDLTEQKRNEETALVRKRLELSQSVGRVGTFDWDVRSGLVVWTTELEALFGLPPRAFDGTYADWAKRVHPDDLAGIEGKIAESLATARPFHGEYRIIWPDGSLHWIEAKGSADYDEQGNATRVVGVNLDVTERKMLELRLARSNAELVEYAAVVSHDLQAPLRTISSYLGVLEARYASLFDDQAKRYFAHVTNGTALMGRLIRGILDYSQAGGADAPVEVIDSADSLREALANLDEAIRQREVVLVSDAMPRIRANRVNLTRLFQNLIGNAIKFCVQQPHITVAARSGEHEWIFSVTDNGPGIAKESTQRIFNLFQRLSHEVEVPGSGIGLATCKKIVERHGGRIWVDSTVGVGSTFFFTIPE